MCLHMYVTHTGADIHIYIYIYTHIYIYQKDRGGKDLYSVEGDVFNSSWPHAKCRMKILNFVHLKN